MKIIVFGSTGRTGKHLVQQGLDAGHTVTAIARNPAAVSIKHPNLTIVKGDVLQLNTFEDVIKAHGAVISVLGKDSIKPTTLYSQGIFNIIAAMQKHNVTRLISMSASAVITNPKLSFFLKIATKILQRILKNPYADILKMEQLIKQSQLNYTIVRPPRLTNTAVTGKYRFAVNGWLPSCTRISRADVAHFMLYHIDDVNTYKSITEVSS